VAAEIIETYFALWPQVEDARLVVLRDQGVREDSGAEGRSLNRGTSSDEGARSAGKSMKPQAGRKPRRP